MTNVALVVAIDIPNDIEHRFMAVTYGGKTWDLSHLDSFAFRCDRGVGTKIDVVVLFSCHCFTHSFKRDGRVPADIPANEIYDDGKERRELNSGRYELSRLVLRNMAMELPSWKIIIANEQRRNL